MGKKGSPGNPILSALKDRTEEEDSLKMSGRRRRGRRAEGKDGQKSEGSSERTDGRLSVGDDVRLRMKQKMMGRRKRRERVRETESSWQTY